MRGLEAQVVATGGSFENVGLIRQQLADVGIVQNDVAAAAAKGAGPFAADGAMADLRALGSLFPEADPDRGRRGFADRRRSPTSRASGSISASLARAPG